MPLQIVVDEESNEIAYKAMKTSFGKNAIGTYQTKEAAEAIINSWGKESTYVIKEIYVHKDEDTSLTGEVVDGKFEPKPPKLL